ncbi:hypothetical protein BASA81_010137 [Batrachochytrium salamandrivorans]|nr:hypothetical protein BASA81_010137 [Batrachochytrium salamandrivorans]
MHAAKLAASKAGVKVEIITKDSAKIAVLKLQNGAQNGLSHALRSGIISGLQQAEKEQCSAVVITGGEKMFSAGADIKEFESGTWSQKPDLGDVINALDALKIPTVAAVNGYALGGGLELAMGCNYRIAGPQTKVGLPEVMLGILPGAQGTQRLPRLAGAKTALELILSGKHVGAGDALQNRIVDQVAKSEEEVLETSVSFASKLTPGQSVPRVSQLPPAEPLSDAQFEEAAKKLSLPGHVSAGNICQAVKAATSPAISFSQGVQVEAELFKQLMASPEASGLQHMFFASRNCTKVKGVDPKTARKVGLCGIIGAGTMGAGIAMCLLKAKVPTILVDRTQADLDRGLKQIEENFKRSSAFKAGKLDLPKTMSLLSTSTDATEFSAFKDVDIVIEAVFENLQLKKDIFAKLDKVCKSSALLCSNTSYLSVDDIANSTKRPESVMGTHFFSPANVMPLLENVRGSKTAPETIATAMEFGKRIGKTTVLSGNAFGFIGNRLFESYSVEAMLLLEEGLLPSEVDAPLRKFGFSMGPLAVLDLAGNDIGYRIRKEPYYPFNHGSKRALSWMQLANTLVESNRLGQKTGLGWFSYQGEDKRKGVVDPVVTEMCRAHAAKHQIENRQAKTTPQDVVDRCVLSLANEGFRVLEERVAEKSGDIDVVWNYGYGFPRARGGPMHYVDNVVGLKNMRDKMLRILDQQPDLPEWHFKPAPLLEQLVKEGKTLKQYEA